jgi:hypothetical protein
MGIIISVPTIWKGTTVIQENIPDQIVLPWLVYYNVILAFVSLVTIFLIWREIKYCVHMSAFVFVSHTLVLFILVLIFITSGNIALKSIMAMALRSGIWITINRLLSSKTG